MPQMQPETIFGGPTKRFFVSMLTRDIELSDAILDLVDNCVDGATRQVKNALHRPHPYEGYEAELTLSAKSFDISDNCGGIPKDRIADAFLLGRPKIEKNIPTIGMYGIGMKRAIFKIGEEAIVESFADDGAFAVTYERSWLNPENDEWNLPIKPLRNRKGKGVTIVVPTLRAEIARQFRNESFINDLKTAISEHFGYLIQKGFSVKVNGEKLRPKTLRLYTTNFTKKKGLGIRPYDFEADTDNVRVRVTVGFFRPLSKIEEVDEEAERPSEIDQAGISVICNDRLVLLNDRTIKTGWGDGAVPRYHPQFRGIAGFIIFSTDEPDKLPISTTKRDLDYGAEVFLQARQYCMEGLRECVAFTNKWKGMEEEANQHFERAERKDARTEVRLAAQHGTPIRGDQNAKKLSAALPIPENRNPMRRISFTRKESDIRNVSEYLFGEGDQSPSMVGQECFDRIHKQSRK